MNGSEVVASVPPKVPITRGDDATRIATRIPTTIDIRAHLDEWIAAVDSFSESLRLSEFT